MDVALADLLDAVRGIIRLLKLVEGALAALIGEDPPRRPLALVRGIDTPRTV